MADQNGYVICVQDLQRKNMANYQKDCDVEGVLNETQGSCVTQHVAGLRVVQYLITFDQTLSNLPYAVNWNGRKQPDQTVAHFPKRNPAKIQIMARQGQTVALYLGSDASPEFRKEPLYQVTVGSNDIEVCINYVAGNTHSDKPEVGQPVKTNVKTDHGDMKDVYDAVLTGDIWMQFSHKYTPAEAQIYASAVGEGDAGLLAFLALLYGGQVLQSGARVAFANGHICKIAFQSDADRNCKEHIKTYAEQGGFSGACLPRVHPNTWLAFLRSLRDNAIEAAEISSTWRPRTGSYGHRCRRQRQRAVVDGPQTTADHHGSQRATEVRTRTWISHQHAVEGDVGLCTCCECQGTVFDEQVGLTVEHRIVTKEEA